MKYYFRMYKSNQTGHFHAIFKEMNGAYDVYNLLRKNVQESELPNISYVGGKRQHLFVRGERGKHEWGLYVLPYIFRQTGGDTEFYFFTEKDKLVLRNKEEE